MVKSLKQGYPNARYERITPDLLAMQAMYGNLAHRMTSGHCKSLAYRMFGGPDGPVWVVDADLLFLRPLSWTPKSPDTILAAAPGGDPKYLEFAREVGFEPVDNVTINAGVLWLNGDLYPLWSKWQEPVLKIMHESPYPQSECIFNIIWHELRKEGKAEALPVSYNQIISEHGPYGATIFHLAGSPEHFRATLMESYYKALCNPEAV
jgi:hypothetical protein